LVPDLGSGGTTVNTAAKITASTKIQQKFSLKRIKITKNNLPNGKISDLAKERLPVFSIRYSISRNEKQRSGVFMKQYYY